MPKETINESAEDIGEMVERCAQLGCNVCSHEPRFAEGYPTTNGSDNLP